MEQKEQLYRTLAKSIFEPFRQKDDRSIIITSFSSRIWKNNNEAFLEGLQRLLQDAFDPRFMNTRHFLSFRHQLENITHPQDRKRFLAQMDIIDKGANVENIGSESALFLSHDGSVGDHSLNEIQRSPSSNASDGVSESATALPRRRVQRFLPPVTGARPMRRMSRNDLMDSSNDENATIGALPLQAGGTLNNLGHTSPPPQVPPKKNGEVTFWIGDPRLDDEASIPNDSILLVPRGPQTDNNDQECGFFSRLRFLFR